MKKVSLFVVALAATTVLATGPIVNAASPQAIPLQGPPAEELVRQVTANRTFPITVDEITRLDSLQGFGDTLTYNFTITAVPREKGARLELSRGLEAQAEALACVSPNYVRLLEGGYTIRLNYALGNPESDVHVRLAPRRCKK